MFRAGRLFSKNKVSKLVLGAVFVPGRPPGAILEPPEAVWGAILAPLGTPGASKTIKKRCTVVNFRVFRYFRRGLQKDA